MAYRPDPKLVITVGSQGADYKFLGQALTEAATVASSSNRILVEVQPGVYNEANPLTVPEWVVVRGRTYRAGNSLLRRLEQRRPRR